MAQAQAQASNKKSSYFNELWIDLNTRITLNYVNIDFTYQYSHHFTTVKITIKIIIKAVA